MPWIKYLCLKSYYANSKCVNKNNPNLNCKGKCALQKELRQLSKNNNSELPIPESVRVSPHEEVSFITHISSTPISHNLICKPFLFSLPPVSFDPDSPPPKILT
ncbi:MAG: hypothetical protein EBS07_01680 [Sphingobacteriia bacterium]|nr:hypothetical protein [Sphingobacteriia bacterium]